jgi:hypothetical protein
MKLKITFIIGVAGALAGLTGCYRIPVPPGPPVPIVNAAPTPVPTTAPPAPPPIPRLTAASSTAPPADRIADPVTAAATCGEWHQQSNYGDRWSAPSTWWEYSCSYSVSQERDFGCTGGCYPECNACYWQTQSWIDYYHWDGADAVFTGQSYTESNLGLGYYNEGYVWGQSDWWDATATQWYDLSPTITSITPASGPVGTVIDIQGSNFNGATSVTIDWDSIAGDPSDPMSYTVDSTSEIHATVPDSATTGVISVTTPDGTASSSTFTVTAP